MRGRTGRAQSPWRTRNYCVNPRNLDTSCKPQSKNLGHLSTEIAVGSERLKRLVGDAKAKLGVSSDSDAAARTSPEPTCRRRCV